MSSYKILRFKMFVYETTELMLYLEITLSKVF